MSRIINRLVLHLFLISMVFLFCYVILFGAGITGSAPTFITLVAAAYLFLAVFVSQQNDSAPASTRGLHLFFILLLLGTIRLALTLAVPVFYGLDPFVNLRILRTIQIDGWSLSGVDYANFGIAYVNPLPEILTLAVESTLGIGAYATVKWLPEITALTVVFIFLFSYRITKSHRAGLVVAYLTSVMYNYILFHSLYVHEAFAFMMLWGCLFAVAASLPSNKVGFFSISSIFAAGVVLTNHLTSLMLAMILMVLGISALILGKLRKSEYGKRFETTMWSRILVVGVLATTMTFGYWAFLSYSPLDVLVLVVRDASRFHPEYYDLPSVQRVQLVLVSEVVFAVAFGLLALASLIFRRESWDLWKAGSVVWGGMGGAFSFALFQRVITYAQLGSTFIAARIELFAYPFLFFASSTYVAKRNSRGHSREVLLVVLLVAFALANVYRIPPYMYSDSQPDYSSGDLRYYLNRAEIAALQWQKPYGIVVTDDWYASFVSPIGDQPENIYHFVSTPQVANVNLSRADFVYLRSDPSVHIDPAGKALLEGPSFNRVYDDGQVTILRG